MTLSDSIAELKQRKNAVILAHFYQVPEIQDIADYIGDSLGLSQQAAKTDADIIVFAGVVFMAETAKILSPEKMVLVPDLGAGCSLADNCPADRFAEFIAQHPGHVVITYVNCSAEVKALSDILCTSSNAEKIIRSVPANQPIIFAPDQHLGHYLIKKTGREMVLWQGSCIVHEVFDAKQIVKLKARHPAAKVIAHPECPEGVLNLADHIGSTSSLLNFVKAGPDNEYIVVTEAGIIHQMKKACPEKTFVPAPTDAGCACNECPFMKMNSLEKLYHCLRDETPEVTVPEVVRIQALKPLKRMLELS
jgi:quinolinate synthase